MHNFFEIINKVDVLLKEFEEKAVKMQLVSSKETFHIQKFINNEDNVVLRICISTIAAEHSFQGLFDLKFYHNRYELENLCDCDAELLMNEYCSKIESALLGIL